MGAENFETISTGKTIQEAYDAAVARARAEHGSMGYTGTIAESRGFKRVDVDAAAARIILGLEEELETLTVARQKKLRAALKVAESATPVDWKRIDRLGRKIVTPYGGQTLSTVLTERRKAVRGAIKELNSKRQSVKAMAVARLYDLDNVDKWGPALAVQLKKGEWCFFGMASC